jgi:hypothetical protein
MNFFLAEVRARCTTVRPTQHRTVLYVGVGSDDKWSRVGQQHQVLLKRNDSVNGTYSASYAHILTLTGCSFGTDAALRAFRALQGVADTAGAPICAPCGVVRAHCEQAILTRRACPAALLESTGVCWSVVLSLRLCACRGESGRIAAPIYMAARAFPVSRHGQL